MNSRQATPDILGDVLAVTPQPVKPTRLSLYVINRSGGTQPRAALDERYIADLVEVLTNGGSLPPVDVTYDGVQYWLHDGFHRWEAHCQAERGEIEAIVHQGDLQAAQWQSYAANQAHGLRRTREDRERAIRAALKHPAGQQLSNREIAKHLGVDDKTIGKYREEMEQAAQIPQVRERTGGDGKVYTQPEQGYLEVWQIESVVRDVSKEASLLRQAARSEGGVVWARLVAALDRLEGAAAWRKRDLKQAINNVAQQLESAVQAVQAKQEDEWQAAINVPGSRQKRVEALARALVPWIRDYKDEYGRTWQDVAARGNVAHTNSTGWRDITKEAKRRGANIPDEFFKDAIKQAYDWLSAEKKAPEPEPQYLTVAQLVESLTPIVAHESAADLRNAATGRDEYYRIPLACQRALYDGPAWRKEDVHAALAAIAEQREAQAPATEPEPETVRLDDLPVVATTGPVVFVVAPNSPPLPDWMVDEPAQEPETAPGQIADLAMRVLNLKLWRASFSMALKNMEPWADATGHHTATLEAERGLRRMVEMTDNELAALAA